MVEINKMEIINELHNHQKAISEIMEYIEKICIEHCEEPDGSYDIVYHSTDCLKDCASAFKKLVFTELALVGQVPTK